VRLRFAEMDHQRPRRNPFASDFDEVFAARQYEAGEFYATVFHKICQPMRKMSCGRPLQAYFGPSSFITT